MNTSNHKILLENVTTKREALAVANSTFNPSVLVERSRLLLLDFITRYLDGKEEREQLINELRIDDGATIAAHLFGIYEHLAGASQMLKECQTFTLQEYNGNDEDTRDSK